MKKKIAVWLLRQFPPLARRDVIIESMKDLGITRRRIFLAALVIALFPGMHLHKNPRRPNPAVSGVDE